MSKRGEWSQGVYQVKDRKKYIGKKLPHFRSSWESRLCFWCDNCTNVKKWGYEVIEIPYLFQIDGKVHKYLVDFYIEVIDRHQTLKKYIVEIKPFAQTQPPKKPKNNNTKALKRYQYGMIEFTKNKNKWEAAKQFCKSRGLIFTIKTEKTLF